MPKILVDGLDWYVRKDTLDEYVIKEARSYFKRINLTEGDIWLDVGANIGAFAVRAAEKALAVVCVEPAPDNLAILHENLELNNIDNVIVIPMALVGASKLKIATLYLNDGKNPGGHSMYVPGRKTSIQVLAVDVNKVVRKYGINKMKIDAEGSEVDILFGLDDTQWSKLNELIFEYHYSILKDKDHHTYAQVLTLLEKQGLDHINAPAPDKGMKNWHTIVAASR